MSILTVLMTYIIVFFIPSLFFGAWSNLTVAKATRYYTANILFFCKDYSNARYLYRTVGYFWDAQDKLIELDNDIKYEQAIKAYQKNNYETAFDIFNSIHYKDSSDKCNELAEHLYEEAVNYIKNQDYETALKLLQKIHYYKEVNEQINQINEILNNNQ